MLWFTPLPAKIVILPFANFTNCSKFEIPEFNIDPITLSSLVSSDDIGDCLPYALLGSYDETIILDEIPITDGLENLSEYIKSIDYVRIKSGTLSLDVDNSFRITWYGIFIWHLRHILNIYLIIYLNIYLFL